MATLSWDDKLRLFDTSVMKGDMTAGSAVKHNNNTGRWLTPFKVIIFISKPATVAQRQHVVHSIVVGKVVGSNLGLISKEVKNGS